MFKKFNIWYDSHEEPYRFLIFLGLVTPGIILTTISETNPVFAGAGLMWLCALLIVRVLGK